MKLYLVRHGEVLHNVLKQYNTADEDLTEKGVEQAKKLREVLNGQKFDAVYSSPLIRALHTAEIIVGREEDIVCDERLARTRCGKFVGY